MLFFLRLDNVYHEVARTAFDNYVKNINVDIKLIAYLSRFETNHIRSI